MTGPAGGAPGAPSWAVILVASTNHAIRGEQLLLGAGIPCRLIPVPRHISSDCGSCLRVGAVDADRAALALKKGKLEVRDIVHLNRYN